jgi:hypothetical protein
MSYDPYRWECSGDSETTTDQVYLRHIRMELQNVTAAIVALTDAIKTQTRVLAAGSESRWAQLPPDLQVDAYKAYTDPSDYAYTPGDRDEHGETDLEKARRLDDEQEPDIDDEPPPDYGPPGSGAVITEWP